MAELILDSLISRNAITTLHRARWGSDHAPVLAKTIVFNPVEGVAQRLHLEHELTNRVRHELVLRSRALVSHQGVDTLLYEDFAGRTLRDSLREHGPFSVDEFLRVALRLCEGLAAIHEAGVVHANPSPSTILIQGESPRIVGLCLSLRGSQEAPPLAFLQETAGSLAYVSPEHSGRLETRLDQRSDLYSFGTIFHEMLCGRPPFADEDPMALIHAHLAREATSLQLIDPDIPPAIAAIVSKLLAKMPEDRYQQVGGLVADLSRCQEAWTAGRPIELFPLGSDDIAGAPIFPDRPFGRSHELRRLIEALSPATPAPSVILLEGNAGSGKSRLASEALRPLTLDETRLVARAKCDPMGSGTPLTTIAEALGSVIRQLAYGSSDRAEHFRELLAGDLAHDARIVANLVPALAPFCPLGPVAVDLAPNETRNRLRVAVHRLIAALCRLADIVIFLDDLQWAGPSTLDVIEWILTAPQTRGPILVGAYRAEECGEELSAFLRSLDDLEIATVNIRIDELSIVGSFVAETLRTTTAAVEPLAAFVHERTRGNPLFLRALLTQLHVRGALRFDRERRQWLWDLDEIRKLPLAHHVVELLGEALPPLPAPALEALETAACLGSSFELPVLARVLDASTEEVLELLGPSIESGAIDHADQHSALDDDPVSTPSRFRFRHDRVQQAVYSRIPPDELPARHLRIGDSLLAALDGDDDPAIETAVLHLTKGRGAIDDPLRLRELARWSLLAARNLEATDSQDAIRSLLQVARELLDEQDEAWEEGWELRWEVGLRFAQASYERGARSDAEAEWEQLLLHARDGFDAARIHEMRLIQYRVNHRIDAAIEAGLVGLAALGEEVLREPDPELLEAVQKPIDAWLEARTLQSAAELPSCEDERLLRVHSLIGELIPTAWIAGARPLAEYLIHRQTWLSLLHGNAPQSAYAYVTTGMLLILHKEEYDLGLEFGQLGVALSERVPDEVGRSAALGVSALFVQCWSQPWRTLQPQFQLSFESGLRTGDLFHAGVAVFQIYFWQARATIADRMIHAEWCVEQLRRTLVSPLVDAVRVEIGALLALAGRTRSWNDISYQGFEESVAMERLHSSGMLFLPAILHINKLRLALFFDEPEEAKRQAERLEELAIYYSGWLLQVPATFYVFAAFAATTEAGDDADDARLKSRRDRMASWTERCPENSAHYLLVMDAILSARAKDHVQAVRLFEKGITVAHDRGHWVLEAYATELCARHHGDLGLESLRQYYLARASRIWSTTGAQAKVEHLQPEMHAAPDIEDSRRPPPSLPPFPTRSETSALDSVDLRALILSTRAMSSEVDLERFLLIMMRILMQASGARSGALLQWKGDTIVRVVESRERDQGLRVTLALDRPLSESRSLPVSIVEEVAHTGERIVLADARASRRFGDDPVVKRERLRSVLCLPLAHRGERPGLLFLSNPLVTGAFGQRVLQIVELLVAQAAVSFETARLYAGLRNEIEQRKKAQDSLQQHKDELEKTVAARTRELTKLGEELVRRERLAALGELTATVSHELRNPMGTIRLSASVISDSVPAEDERIHRAIERLQRNVSRCDRIIEELLDYTRITNLEKRATNLDRWIETLVNETELPEVVETRFEGGLGGASCAVDQDLLRRALLNLVHNAADALVDAGGGILRVKTGVFERQAEVLIEDDGSGIDETTLARIFEPLFSTKAFGIGLGLPTVKRIVEDHGGTIGIESRRGGPTCVRLLLPLG